MQDSKDLVQQVEQEIRASKTISPTPPGQSERVHKASEAHVEAINQVFSLFLLNYHNQFYAAFPEDSKLVQIKRLWLEALGEIPVEQILKGAKHAIESSEYLPTLNRMLECCQQGLADYGLPAPREAYMEACQAGSPRTAQNWSHPAVYLAGRDSDWYFLSNNPERTTWPVFRDHYQRYCAQVLRGESLQVPESDRIEHKAPEPLTREEQLAELARLREESGL